MTAVIEALEPRLLASEPQLYVGDLGAAVAFYRE
jgi:predicted component of type VI protein secretion system